MIRTLEKKYRIRAGSINPNLFQAQEYKFGSICNPDPEVRHKALPICSIAWRSPGN